MSRYQPEVETRTIRLELQGTVTINPPPDSLSDLEELWRVICPPARPGFRRIRCERSVSVDGGMMTFEVVDEVDPHAVQDGALEDTDAEDDEDADDTHDYQADLDEIW